jgi:histidyl-tRNA synthetase
MIAMLCNILGEIGIPRGSFTATINSLGEPEERPAYREALVTYLRAHEAQLDDDSRRRLELNPLRVLDSKSPDVQALVASAPVILDHLGEASRARFARVQETLTALGVGFEIDPRLVRGLDYYTSTIFEIKVTAGELGAQNTVCGGGRYDRLVESLGGPKTPAMGFGLGLERALLAMPDVDTDGAGFEPGLQVFIATLDAAALEYALPIGHRLRLAGIRTEIEHRGGSLKSQLKRADKLRARLALIVGETEVATRRLQVKDLAAGQQHEVAEADLLPRLHALLD